MPPGLYTTFIGSFLCVYIYCVAMELEGCIEPEWFLCANRKLCVSSTFKCDGTNDCGDNSDEIECNGYKPLYNPIECANGEHKCENKSCIPTDKFCDKVTDCPDGSDEYDGCTKDRKCESFLCDDGNCIRKEWVCDATVDCDDGSDEKNCEAITIAVEHCNEQIDRYLCKNQRCIPLKAVCDTKDDCGDGSDEDVDGCARADAICAHVTQCKHFCRRTPTGALCTCQPGFRLLDHNMCIDIDECTHYGICDQRCINSVGSYSCACYTDYSLQDDSKSCKAEGGEGLLVFSEQTEIRGYYLDSKVYFSIIRNLSHATAISLDANYIYWSDVRHGEEMIAKRSRDRSDIRPEIIVTAGLSAAADIAIDWITDNIYFTDEGYAHIGVCTANGSFCTVVIRERVNKPKALALVPLRGIMYWSDWGLTPHIGTASMDGRNVASFITENVGWAMSLTIDYPTDRLYWVDSKLKVIETVRLNGEDRKTVLREIAKHPFSLAVFENRLYWSDWLSNTVQSCNKFTGKDWKILIRSKSAVYGVHVYHPVLKPKIPNPCNSNPCSQICLLNSSKEYTCACTLDSELSADRRTCNAIKKRQHVIIAAGNTLINYYHNLLGKPKISSTTAEHYITALAYDSLTDAILANDQLTNTVFRYDTKSGQTTDLMSTKNEFLSGMEFDYIGNNLYRSDMVHKTVAIHSLNTGHTVFLYFQEEPHDIALAPEEGFMFLVVRAKDVYRIDRISMSGVGTRIRLIEGKLFGPTIALCYDKELRRIFWIDQGRGRIESATVDGREKRLFRTGLSEPVALVILKHYVFWTEHRSNYLYWVDKNNGQEHYKRVSLSELDRADCSSYAYYRVMFLDIPKNVETLHLTSIGGLYITDDKHGCHMNNGNCSHVCLVTVHFPGHICACPPEMTLNTDNTTCTKLIACHDDEIECDGRQVCIKQHQRCDGMMDCPNGDDEIVHCNTTDHCQKNQFTCTDGECIDLRKRCNYHDDCTDRSDEKGCERKMCEIGEFQCREGNCISQYLVCNGEDDCLDYSDEINCNDHTCSGDSFMCGTHACIPRSWMCDGQSDCGDGSDETGDCIGKKCATEMFMCKNGRCIDTKLVCDMADNCGDGSDEHDCYAIRNGGTTVCKENEYKCNSTIMCVDKQSRCNGVEDCPERDDERDCPQCNANTEFTCENGKCIPQSWMCDLFNDCGDKSDERDCTGDETTRKLVSVLHTHCKEYKCSIGNCLPFDRVCDGTADCSDGSDEFGKCTSSCIKDNPCKYRCHKTPLGPVCDCPIGYRLSTDGTSCTDVNECDGNVCSQICRNTEGSFVCSCYDGFILRNDKVSCKVTGPAMEIIVAVKSDIRRVSSSLNSIEVILQEPSDDVTGLDVNANSGTVYWSNAALGTIGEIKMNGKQRNMTTAVRRPEVLAVDWITDNIYVYDGSDPHSIKACSLSGQKCAMIITIPEVKRVTSVVVNPPHGLLFWCEADWGLSSERVSSEIYRSSMVGSNITAIVAQGLGIVSGIAIDYEKFQLYWSDILLNVIEFSDLNGNNRKIFLQTKDIHRPMGISIYDSSIYWLAGTSGQLQKCKLRADKSCTMIDLGHFNVGKYFTISHISRQPLVVNSCRNRVCDYMCVLKENDYACVCQNGYGPQSGAICKGYNIMKMKQSSSVMEHAYQQSGPLTDVIIGITVAVLILSGYCYYQRVKPIQSSKKSDVCVRFQNPSFDRKEVLPTLSTSDLAYSSMIPGQHEYVNPTVDLLRKTEKKSMSVHTVLTEIDEKKD